jgi:hypothetical protein
VLPRSALPGKPMPLNAFGRINTLYEQMQAQTTRPASACMPGTSRWGGKCCAPRPPTAWTARCTRVCG